MTLALGTCQGARVTKVTLEEDTFTGDTFFQARALRALGLLLADGTPTVGGGKTF